MSHRLRSAACLALLAVLPLGAQPLPDQLEWELVGSVIPTGTNSLASIDGVGFHQDTLLATGERSVWAYDPATDAWTDRRNWTSIPLSMAGPIVSGEALGVPGVLFLDRGRLHLSVNGGRTWALVGAEERTFALPVRTPSGRLVAGHNGLIPDGDVLSFSTNAGLTWTRGTFFPGDAGVPYDFAATAPTPDAPQGRLVTADFLGTSYSTDDGQTWQRSTLHGPYRAYSVDVVRPGPRDGGHAGRFVTGAISFDRFRSYVYTSDDGGQTWQERFAYPLDGERGLQVVAAPDGAVYMYNDRFNTARHLFGSSNGGDTWQDLGPMGLDWPFGAAQMAVGPDGRLYVGGPDGVPAYNPMEDEAAGGVFRTVLPVVATAAQAPAPDAPSGLGLRTFPNPSGGAVTIALSGHAASEAVRVSVYDTLGREVAVLHEGPSPTSAQYTLDGASLAPGSYVARAEAEGLVATAAFTVAE